MEEKNQQSCMYDIDDSWQDADFENAKQHLAATSDPRADSVGLKNWILRPV